MSNDWDNWTKEQSGAGDNAIAVISGLVDDLQRADEEVERLEEELKKAKAAARELREVKIPERMEDMEVEELTTKSGVKVKIEEKVSASPKKDDRESAWDWLEDNGHGALVKRQAIFAFGKGEDEEKAAREMIAGASRPGRFERGVHPSTLSSWVREQLEEGTEIPMELLGVRRVRRAKTTTG
jgi:hypothetical protein